MTIQWFPGHMAKARREVTERLKLVDIVFELVDARLPASSSNPMLQQLIQQKPHLILLNKADMADQDLTQKWIRHYYDSGHRALAINSLANHDIKRIINTAEEVLKEKRERQKARGLRQRAIRAMIIGIPNVGKSTLINRLARRKVTRTGNMPGVTRAQQWIKVGKSLELLDTPGILWPKFEDPEIGYKLAITGAIKDSLLNMQDVAVFCLRFLKAHYPERLQERYKLDEIPENIVDLFDKIGQLRGCLVTDGEIDYDQVAEVVIMDVRMQKLGKLTFDLP